MNDAGMDLEPWLGQMSPSEFESAEEIDSYYSAENLAYMFGADEEIDEDEAERARVETVRLWEEAQ